MKRQGYIDYLKSLGCVFYCPFDGVSGTTDLINNVAMTVSGEGSILYDSTLDMYRVQTPSSQGKHTGYWNNGITASGTFPNNNFTTIYTIKKITSANNKSIFGVSPYSDNFRTCQALNPNYNSTGGSSSWPSTVTKVAIAHNYTESWRKLYQDGVLYTQASIFAQFVPANWITSNSGLCLGRTPIDSNTSFQSVSEYIKDVYIFNTALDLGTIRSIQGFD